MGGDNMSFAKWVRDAREARKLTIVECATRAGISHPTWVEYENATKNKQPKRETVKKIALALGIDVDEAMEAAGYSADTPDVPAEWARLWLSTPPDQREKLMKITRGAHEALAAF
jgi:transcriptional regulator with XRE-family HTH domain